MSNKGFIDLAEYQRASTPPGHRGNIIKGEHVVVRGSEQIGVPSDGPSEPTVVLHRDGENVTAVEFVCKCGRSATVHLDYAQE